MKKIVYILKIEKKNMNAMGLDVWALTKCWACRSLWERREFCRERWGYRGEEWGEKCFEL